MVHFSTVPSPLNGISRQQKYARFRNNGCAFSYDTTCLLSAVPINNQHAAPDACVTVAQGQRQMFNDLRHVEGATSICIVYTLRLAYRRPKGGSSIFIGQTFGETISKTPAFQATEPWTTCYARGSP